MPNNSAELQYIADTARATWWIVYATWVLAAVTLAVAIGTLWIMWRQLRESKATTQLDLHLRLVDHFECGAMSAIRSRVAAALLRGQQPAPNDIASILDRLESIAYYANRKTLDLELVWNDFAYYVRCYWHQLNNYVVSQRGIRNDKTLYSETEKLYLTLDNEEPKRRGSDEPMAYVTEEELKAFLESEADVSDRLAIPRSLR